MIKEDKLGLLLDIVKNPQKYSEEQKKEILLDDECRSLYEQLVDTKSADDFAKSDDEINMPDINNEWDTFNSTLRRRNIIMWRNIAAAIIGVLIVSGISYATILHYSHKDNPQPQQTTTAVTKPMKDSIAATPEKQDTAVAQTYIFNNVELKAVMTEISNYYKVPVSYKKATDAHIRLYLRWDKSAGIDDVINMINHFDKVNLRHENDTIYVE